MTNKTRYQRNSLVILATLALIGAGCTATVPPAPAAPAPAPAAPAPAAPAAIINAVMSRSVDASGDATGATSVFNAKTDKIVYAVLTLQNAKKTTKLSYIRKLNGKYVDSKVAQPSADGVKYFNFVFEKGVGSYKLGTYTLDLFTNGKLALSLSYQFK